jgi:hypothetical protein
LWAKSARHLTLEIPTFKNLDCLSKGADNLPKVIIHRLEEKLVIRSIESILKIPECHTICRHWEFYQIWSVFIVYVVDDFCLPHPEGCAGKNKNLTMTPPTQAKWRPCFATLSDHREMEARASTAWRQ